MRFTSDYYLPPLSTEQTFNCVKRATQRRLSVCLKGGRVKVVRKKFYQDHNIKIMINSTPQPPRLLEREKKTF